jgi:hypothetical protein
MIARSLAVIAAALVLAGCTEQAVSTARAAGDLAVVAELRNLHTAQTQFFQRNNRFGTLEELADFVADPALRAGRKHNYIFTLVSADESSYAFRADPADESKFSYRHFYIDQSGTVRANHTRPAGPNDPPCVM